MKCKKLTDFGAYLLKYDDYGSKRRTFQKICSKAT